MKKDIAKTLRAFLIELVIYSILVVVYFFFVLHFLAEWLPGFHQHHRVLYSATAILLILGQAVLLEIITSFILRMVSGRSE